MKLVMFERSDQRRPLWSSDRSQGSRLVHIWERSRQAEGLALAKAKYACFMFFFSLDQETLVRLAIKVSGVWRVGVQGQTWEMRTGSWGWVQIMRAEMRCVRCSTEWDRGTRWKSQVDEWCAVTGCFVEEYRLREGHRQVGGQWHRNRPCSCFCCLRTTPVLLE